MALEAFLNSNRKLAMPLMTPVNEDGGILRVVRSLSNEEQSDSIVSMAHMNVNMTSAELMNTLLGTSLVSGFPPSHDASNSSFPFGAYLGTHGSTDIEPYFNYLSSISLPRNNHVLNYSTAEVLSPSSQGRQLANKRKHLENHTTSKDVPKSQSLNSRDSLDVRVNEEPGNLNLFLEKTRYDIDQENINQSRHEIYQQLLMQDHNLQQLNTLEQQHRHQHQIHQAILHSAPQFRGHQLQLSESQTRNLLQDNFV